MRLSCPACGACGSLEFFLMDAAARKSVTAALAMPSPIGKQLMTYIGLFRPGKRSLTWDRVEKLLEELVPFIQSGQLDFDGRTWAAPQDYWVEALTEMLLNRDNLRTPLKNHNYLYRMIANRTSSADAMRERQQEEKLRHRPQSSGSGPVQVGQVVKKHPPRSGAPQELLDAAGVKKSHVDSQH